MAVKTELEPPILSLTLDRPKANAFDHEQVEALSAAIEAARAVDGARALVIHGAGDTAWSAGADLGAVGPLAEPEGLSGWTTRAHAMLDRIAALDFPAIAAMRRPAAGGGFELALACHFRVLGAGAHVSLPEIRRGYLPSWAAVERLMPLVGPAKTLDLLLTGRRVEAAEALALGLVHRVAEDADQAARELAEELSALPPLAVRAALDQVRGAARGEPSQALRAREAGDLARLVRTEDTVEGVMAFFEKRAAVFKGR